MCSLLIKTGRWPSEHTHTSPGAKTKTRKLVENGEWYRQSKSFCRLQVIGGGWLPSMHVPRFISDSQSMPKLYTNEIAIGTNLYSQLNYVLYTHTRCWEGGRKPTLQLHLIKIIIPATMLNFTTAHMAVFAVCLNQFYFFDPRHNHNPLPLAEHLERTYASAMLLVPSGNRVRVCARLSAFVPQFYLNAKFQARIFLALSLYTLSTLFSMKSKRECSKNATRKTWTRIFVLVVSCDTADCSCISAICQNGIVLYRRCINWNMPKPFLLAINIYFRLIHISQTYFFVVVVVVGSFAVRCGRHESVE